MNMYTRISLIEKEINFISKSVTGLSEQISKLDERVNSLDYLKHKIYGALFVSNIVTALIINLLKP